MRRALAVVLLTGLLASPALAAGSLPLADVMARMKAYPTLVLQIRLQLVRAGKKRDEVTCIGQRFGNHWVKLGGERALPYECAIGKRTVVIKGTLVYEDASGRRLKDNDPELPRKAARVRESRVTWAWR